MPSPLRTAVVQATSLGTASNLLAQIISASHRTIPIPGLLLGWLDVPQLLRFVVFSFLTAPLNYHFQLLLEHAFPGRRRRPALFRHKRSDDPEQLAREKEKEREREKLWSPTASSSALFPSPSSSSSSSSSSAPLDWPNTMIKWFLDAVSLGPFLNNVAFLAIMGFLKGQSSRFILYTVQTVCAPPN